MAPVAISSSVRKLTSRMHLVRLPWAASLKHAQFLFHRAVLLGTQRADVHDDIQRLGAQLHGFFGLNALEVSGVAAKGEVQANGGQHVGAGELFGHDGQPVVGGGVEGRAVVLFGQLTAVFDVVDVAVFGKDRKVEQFADFPLVHFRKVNHGIPPVMGRMVRGTLCLPRVKNL